MNYSSLTYKQNTVYLSYLTPTEKNYNNSAGSSCSDQYSDHLKRNYEFMVNFYLKSGFFLVSL